MQDSKLIGLLKTFEKEDWRWFRKFLLSPYFNSRQELIPFFDYLRKCAPEFKEKAIQKKKVFKKLFPHKSYDEKLISYEMNFLLNQAERFLAQRELELQPPIINSYLLKSLVNRQLDKHYKYQHEKSHRELKDWKSKDIDFYLFNYKFAEVANIHFDNQNLRQHSPHLQTTSDNLDQFFIINKMKYYCEMMIRSKVMKVSYNANLEKEIINYIDTKDFSINPLISTYLEAYYTLKNNNAETNFENLKRLLLKWKEDLPASEKQKLHLYGINYCINQIGKGNKAKYYVEQCLELYLAGIEQGFLLNKGYLSPWTFKNVVKLGLNLKKYNFTENFIQKYHKKLEEEFQEDALHFNLADINYRKKNYQIAQTHLIQVQYSDVFYNLGAKAMLLKIYYETEEVEALFALVASFSIYLRRDKKISADFKEPYSNFTSFLAKILRAKRDKLPVLTEKIKETKSLTNRQWLLEICKAN